MGCTTLPRLGSRVRIPSSAPRAFAGQRSFGAAHARFGCMRSRAQAAVRPRAGGELAGTHERPSLRVRKRDPSSSVSDDRVARLAGGRGCGHVGIGDDSVHRSRRFDRALPGRRRRRGRRPPARALHGAAPGDRAHGRYRGQDDRRRVDGLVPGGGGRDRRCGGDAAGSRRANRRAAGARLAMRVGISAGDASFEDGDWFGTPVVEASRLCAAAEGDQILASDIVRVLAGSRTEHELRLVGEVDAKGMTAITACEVVWTRLGDRDTAAQAVPLPPVIDQGDAFVFVGRDAERDVVVDAWKEVLAGARRVVLVAGEPGIGKTRLVKEVCRLAHEQGGVVLWGGCEEELGIPYQPFAEALRWYATAVPLDDLRAVLGPLGGELTRLVPDLARFVPGLDAPVVADPETERYRLFEATADLFGRDLGAGSGTAGARRPALGGQADPVVAPSPAPRDGTAAAPRRDDLPRYRSRSHASARRDARRPAAGARRRAAGVERPRRGRSGAVPRAHRRPRARRRRPRARAGGARRDRGQPVLRGRGAAPSLRERRDRVPRRTLDVATSRSNKSAFPKACARSSAGASPTSSRP